MKNKITVKIDTFEFETKYASQEYTKCGLFIRFEDVDREFRLVFDSRSICEMISEIDMYFRGDITEGTEAVYYPPWIVGNFIIYPITYWIDPKNKTWLFRHKKSQNDPEFDFLYSLTEDDIRSIQNQLKKQYDAISWDSLGRVNLYSFDLPDKSFDWCYSAKMFQKKLTELCMNKEIKAVYVSSLNYSSPLHVGKNTVNYYLGSEVLVELDDIVLDLLIHAEGLFEWRFFSKKEIKLIGPTLDFIEDGKNTFCKVESAYHAFECEYCASCIQKISVGETTFWPWTPCGFDQTKLGSPVEVPQSLWFHLKNGNALSFIGRHDDFVIAIASAKGENS